MNTNIPYEKDSKERMPWEHYLEEYQKADPKEIASRLGIDLDEETSSLKLTFLGTTYHITHPDFTVTHDENDMGYYPLEESIYAKILTLRFLLNGANVQGTGQFKTYREMPWGEVYLRQFDGRCIKRLAFSYGTRIAVFDQILTHMGARKLNHGDTSYALTVYPGYEVQMILWEGDEEFPPSSQFLFSDNFPIAFEAEDIAQMGDVIIGSMKAFQKVLA